MPSFAPRTETILIVILILFLLGALGTIPTWPHSRNWGYGPSGGLGLPPLAVGLKAGIGFHLFLNIILKLLFYVRGLLHALWVVLKE
jgi:uncharacterized membrane protein YqaE (UPF0057 family)